MTNVLLRYLEKRHILSQKKIVESSIGPVITISRDFGCPANMCATDLAELLTKLGDQTKEPWKVISKEILEQAAKDLNVDPEKIEYIFKFEKRSAIDEVLESLSSKYYKSERKIRKTIREIIRSFGESGRVIVVGRAGSTILSDLPNSLHVKLIAPLEFRIEGVSRRHQISYAEAKKLTLSMDKRRSQLRTDFEGRRIYDVDYDIILNSKIFKTDEMVNLIVEAAKLRDLV